MQSTIKLFKYLYDRLPPLFSYDLSLRMKAELENLERQNLPLEKVEDTMIGFGYEIWPWNQAYKYFLEDAERRLGDHFLLPQMSEGLREKYLNFKICGGELKDLKTGRPACFFTPEERAELCVELVDTRLRIKDYVDRELVGMNRKEYMNKVEEYKKLLEKIKINVEYLRKLACEEDHPVLSREINTKIRDFEYGLCALGVEPDFEAVCRAPDFFAGRKAELNRLRGIDIPLQIVFG